MVDYHLAWIDFVNHFDDMYDSKCGHILMEKWITSLRTCADDLPRIIRKMKPREAEGIDARIYFYARYMRYKCSWSEEEFVVKYAELVQRI
jgi:hypothetical protein